MKIFCIISLTTTLTVSLALQNVPADHHQQNSLPKGYYGFAKAATNARPPKVRKPPYLPITAECPGLLDTNTLIAKNNMCGDLNRGFIPRNPMGQYLFGQPYPFEIIKNKTLQYLSKTLPYLKEEIDNVPKVARFVKPSEFFENHSKRHARQAVFDEIKNDGKIIENTIKVADNNNGSISSSIGPENNATNVNSVRQQNRQNVCEGNVICQAIESLKEEGPFSKNFLSNVFSAVGNVASINNVVSLLDHYGQSNQSSSPTSSSYSSSSSNTQTNNGNRFAFSQLLSSVSSLGNTGESGNPASANHNNGIFGSSGSSSSYSPLLSIIDYIQSLQTPKYATKRKTPSDVEDLFVSEGPEKPQTPCMSTEEYISPTYARNYQGVWKYVVQIPNEGYFTQTIQQTTCLKNKCDLIEGACRESPRWVSLLVAEIFYPDIYFPVNQIMPMLYKQQQQQQQQLIQQQSQQPYKPMMAATNPKRTFPVSGSPNAINHHLDFSLLNNLLKRSDIGGGGGATNHPGLQNLELIARKARNAILAAEPRNEPEPNSVDQDNEQAGNNGDLDGGKSNAASTKHCDGYDKIGCYVVRVYYDWFLVNGSCKCWKSSSSSGINETIKRIFIGKWKKK